MEGRPITLALVFPSIQESKETQVGETESQSSADGELIFAPTIFTKIV